MHMHKLVLAGIASATALTAGHANAQDYYVGQIVLYANTFCPHGSTEAAGQIVPISYSNVLFSLFGTTYGGDGRTNFGIPDLRGRAPVGQGTRSGSTYPQGLKTGAEQGTLTVANLPSHTHAAQMQGVAQPGTTTDPANADYAELPAAQKVYNSTQVPDAAMANGTLATTNAGSNIPVSLRAPYTTMRFCVWVQGYFPPRP